MHDTTFYERVLDIKDADVAKKLLPVRIKVTELSYNERQGYLCHSSALEEVIISESEPEMSAQSVADSSLPKNALSYFGGLRLTSNLSYVNRTIQEL